MITLNLRKEIESLMNEAQSIGLTIEPKQFSISFKNEIQESLKQFRGVNATNTNQPVNDPLKPGKSISETIKALKEQLKNTI